MKDKGWTRRGLLERAASGAAVMALAGAASPLGACSAPSASRQSYIHSVIRPEHLSPVFVWTDIMLQAIRNQSVTPPPATRAFAMAHTAGFLAVNGIEQAYETPYRLEGAPAGADPAIAYGVAFSLALGEGLQSSFAFDRKRFVDGFPDGPAKSAAIDYGTAAADVVIRARIRDGAEPNQSEFYHGRYPRRQDVLRWSPTGPFYETEFGPRFGTFNRGLLPGWGAQKTWVMKDRKEFLAAEFPDPDSPEFQEEFETIRLLGASDSTIRTADQTQIAYFWEDGPRGVTPPGHWQIIAMGLVQDRGFSLIEQARLFALLSAAQADAAITCWDTKYHYDIIRPETAIRRRAHRFSNPAIQKLRDPGWTSLIPTPGFPAYTSGHSTFSGTSGRMLANFLGDDSVSFSSQSPDLVNWPRQLTGVTRSWTSIWQAAEEGGASRLYGGIHWDADNREGLRVGRDLADYVFVNAFQNKI